MPENEVIPIREGEVQGFLHSPRHPSGDALALTHGAGANCQSPLLVALAREFCAAGTAVLRYDLPFRQLRPQGPPMRGSDKKDRAGIALSLEFLRQRFGGRIFAGGHSYGGRQTSMLLAERPELAKGLLLLSYPLHPPKKPAQMRTAHFPEIRTPALFVHGTRDSFGTLEEMRAALALIPAETRLLEVESAGHELMTTKNREELAKNVVNVFVPILARLLSGQHADNVI